MLIKYSICHLPFQAILHLCKVYVRLQYCFFTHLVELLGKIICAKNVLLEEMYLKSIASLVVIEHKV